MASTVSGSTAFTFQADPDTGTFKRRFGDVSNFFFDSENGKVLGKTFQQWLFGALFYIAFYCCIVALMLACGAVVYQTLDWNMPRLTAQNSILQLSPSLGFRPLPDSSTTLIRFIKGNKRQYSILQDNLEAYLLFYENQNQVTDTGAMVDCKTYNKRRPQLEWDKACRFELQDLGKKCIKQQDFGMRYGQPCVLLKLNRVFDWHPENYHNDSDIPSEIKDTYLPYYVHLKCFGVTPADEDNMGRIEYYPAGGFHFKYFPFRNQQGYRSPLVFVRFPSMSMHILVMIECRAYARNIRQNSVERVGTVRFELLVD
ncbi:sodium/potassium-transporting ATPase subunit beta [Mytilus galloprovincialis]|uniref:Sodium/potassium-transporting ATPase subunit beta n=1 Tax=Mytilus galloprovincialis TaxID=29158 RepID=A0A8B6F918_MYTGA|nr:sodium/potassium-transporting ATPase subunit beta [Mytilus galloprovincialis]